MNVFMVLFSKSLMWIRRHWIQVSILELVIPVGFVTLLLIIRNTFPIGEISDTENRDKADLLMSCTALANNSICYCPDSGFSENIMSKVKDEISTFGVKSEGNATLSSLRSKLDLEVSISTYGEFERTSFGLVEDYTICETSLEEVFMSFAKKPS